MYFPNDLSRLTSKSFISGGTVASKTSTPGSARTLEDDTVGDDDEAEEADKTEGGEGAVDAEDGGGAGTGGETETGR